MTIVILGAGDIGAALARQLAAADLVARVVMVDEAAAVAAGKALDIVQSGPIDGFATMVSGTDDESAVVGADIVAIADRVTKSAEWEGEDGLALVGRVCRLNQAAPILCVGASASSLVEHGVGELGLSSSRIFGTAPSALEAAIVALTGLEADHSPAEISVSVVGRAPGEIIVGWEAARIGGRRATDVLSPPAILRLDDRLPRLWPPGPTTLASAAADVVGSMLTRARRTHALLVAGSPPVEATLPPSQTLRRTAVALAEAGQGRLPGHPPGPPVEATLQGRLPAVILPARVHRRGILRLETPSLSPRERTRLETALGG